MNEDHKNEEMVANLIGDDIILKDDFEKMNIIHSPTSSIGGGEIRDDEGEAANTLPTLFNGSNSEWTGVQSGEMMNSNSTLRPSQGIPSNYAIDDSEQRLFSPADSRALLSTTSTVFVQYTISCPDRYQLNHW